MKLQDEIMKISTIAHNVRTKEEEATSRVMTTISKSLVRETWPLISRQIKDAAMRGCSGLAFHTIGYEHSQALAQKCVFEGLMIDGLEQYKLYVCWDLEPEDEDEDKGINHAA